MISLVHSADLHFGRTKHSSVDPKTGLQTSLINDMETFHEFIDFSEKENVDIVVLAGDVFDKIHVSNAVRKEVAKAFRRVLEKRHLYVITGTHDMAHDPYAAHTLSDWKNFAGGFDEGHMARLHIFEQPTAVFHYDEYGKEQAQVIALPEPTQGILEGRSYFEYISKFFNSLTIRKDIPVIVIAHFTVSGAVAGDETKDLASFAPKESMPCDFFDSFEHIDYVALGHIHKAQELGKTGKIVYPGSLNYCSFSELNEVKGFYSIDISDEKKLEKKFIELKSPIHLYEINIDVCGDLTPMETIRKKIESIDCEGSIIKVVVKFNESEFSRISKKELEQLLIKSISFSVSYNPIRSFKTRDSSITASCDKKFAFDNYLNLINPPDDVKKKMQADYLALHEKYEKNKN